MYRLSLILGASLVGLLSFVDLVEASLTNKNGGGLKDDEVGVSVFGRSKNMPEIKIDGNVKDLMNNRNLRGGKGRGAKGGKGGAKAGKRRKRASKASQHHDPNLFGDSPTTFPTPSGNDIVNTSTSSTIGSTPATKTTTIPPPTTPRPSPKLLTFAPNPNPNKKPNVPEKPKFKGEEPTSSPTTFCTITEGYSNGSAGDLLIDANGIITLDGNPITSDSRFFDSTTLGTAPDAITTFENINNFIIHAGQTVDVLGTVEVKAIGVDIQEGATLNGNGGGYAGGARRTSINELGRENGSGPGSGQGGYSNSGGAGAGHGGNGGQGGWQFSNARAYGGTSYDTTLPIVELQPGSGGGGGSGWNSLSGGRGGHGGAAIRLFAVDTIALNGTILSNGENGEGCTNAGSTCGYSGGGGGSGGSISLSACTIDAGSSSLVQANGGAGGKSRFASNSINCGGGGGGGGVIKTEMTNTIGTLVLQVYGGSPPSGGRKLGDAGSDGKVFLPPDDKDYGDTCTPSYLDPNSSPFDFGTQCRAGFCRNTDGKCGCTSNSHCSSGQVCHSDNKCYSSGLSYEQDCSADNGSAVDARCTSGFCRNTDGKCGCTSSSHCSSGQVCHSDNKCYSSGLSYEQDCSADNGSAVDARCTSGFCRNTDGKCGCTSNDHCSSGQVCHSDNKCYSSGLSYEQDCSADNGSAVDARCTSGFCRNTDGKCGCTSNDHCSSGQVCHSDNKCYSSGLSYEQDCSADNGSAVDARCTSGFCRNTDGKCGCTSNSHCKYHCHSDNKCYSSGLSYEQDCSADNGSAVDARCTSGFCRNRDGKCGCTSNDHCSSGEACQLSEYKCYVSDLSHGESCLVNDDRVEARCASGFCRSNNKCGCDEDSDCSNYEICTGSNTCVEGGKYSLKAFCSGKKNALSTDKKCVRFMKEPNGSVEEYCTSSQCNPDYPNDSYIEIESSRLRLQSVDLILHGEDTLKLDGFLIQLEGQNGRKKDISEWVGDWALSTGKCRSKYYGIRLSPGGLPNTNWYLNVNTC